VGWKEKGLVEADQTMMSHSKEILIGGSDGGRGICAVPTKGGPL
jgi:hypothetical protein